MAFRIYLSKFRHNPRIASVTLGLLMAVTANAQATRTWVSAVGDDANPCSRTAPCKTFAGAISKTAAGGEINAMDAGAFGTVTVNKALTIDGGETMAGVLAAGTVGINVNAGANDTVILRNLKINGIGGAASPTVPGTKGVAFIAGKALIIDRCDISGFAPRGISIETGMASNNAQVFIRETNLFRNFSNGIVINPQGGASVQVSLDGVNIVSSTNFGISATSGSSVVLRGTNIRGSGLSGLRTDGTGGSVTLSVEGGMITGNSVGIEAGTNSTIYLADTTVGQNNTGISMSGGLVYSFGNNRIAANNFGNGPLTGLSLQ